MKSLMFGNTIVCEFATKGENNKHTLVNVFHGDIILWELPGEISLAFYFEIIASKSGAQSISFEFQLDSKKLATLEAAFSVTNPNETVPLIISRLDIKVERECTLSVVASGDGVKAHPLISKRIFKNKAAAP